MDATPETAGIGPETVGPESQAERRGETRAAMALMRSAKLVCQSGEYVCMLRDVSSGGVRISLFHPVPAETHVFLELPSGEVHAMIRVWERGTAAGFRFAQPVDPAEFLAALCKTEGRQLCLRLRVPGMALANGIVQPVMLCELAAGGAMIEADGYLALGQRFIISIDRLGECHVRVRARRGRSYEIGFDAVSRLDQLAGQALALQPLHPPAVPQEALRGVA